MLFYKPCFANQSRLKKKDLFVLCSLLKYYMLNKNNPYSSGLNQIYFLKLLCLYDFQILLYVAYCFNLDRRRLKLLFNLKITETEIPFNINNLNEANELANFLYLFFKMWNKSLHVSFFDIFIIWVNSSPSFIRNLVTWSNIQNNKKIKSLNVVERVRLFKMILAKDYLGLNSGYLFQSYKVYPRIIKDTFNLSALKLLYNNNWLDLSTFVKKPPLPITYYPFKNSPAMLQPDVRRVILTWLNIHSKNVMIINSNNLIIQDIIYNIYWKWRQKDIPTNLKSKGFVFINSKKILNWTDVLEFFAKPSSNNKEIDSFFRNKILIIPTFGEFLEKEWAASFSNPHYKPFTNWCWELHIKYNVKILAGISTEQFEWYVKPNLVLQKLFHQIPLRSPKIDSVKKAFHVYEPNLKLDSFILSKTNILYILKILSKYPVEKSSGLSKIHDLFTFIIMLFKVSLWLKYQRKLLQNRFQTYNLSSKLFQFCWDYKIYNGLTTCVKDKMFENTFVNLNLKYVNRFFNRFTKKTWLITLPYINQALKLNYKLSEMQLTIIKENTPVESIIKNLSYRIIGQDKVIHLVSLILNKINLGFQNKQKPIASLFFAGPSGVGKTEVAKTIAKEAFGSEKNILRFDMSEFSLDHSDARLIGSPPGYVGSQKGGELTEAVEKNPYALVLFDEFEKAHSSIANLLLQLLDDGRLTDRSGKSIDFTQTIIIFTTNIGYKKENENNAAPKKRQEYQKQLKRSWKENLTAFSLHKNFVNKKPWNKFPKTSLECFKQCSSSLRW